MHPQNSSDRKGNAPSRWTVNCMPWAVLTLCISLDWTIAAQRGTQQGLVETDQFNSGRKPSNTANGVEGIIKLALSFTLGHWSSTVPRLGRGFRDRANGKLASLC